MRILLISPSHYNPDGSLHKTTRYWTSALTLPYLKALTPPGHDVRMVDELFYDVDLDCDADVVGITAMGPQVQRAYDLADLFRAVWVEDHHQAAVGLPRSETDSPDKLESLTERPLSDPPRRGPNGSALGVEHIRVAPAVPAW